MPAPIPAVSRRQTEALRAALARQSEVAGGFGLLERLALRIGLIQDTPTPALRHATLVICAGDHGSVEANPGDYLPVDTTVRLRAVLAGHGVGALALANGLDLLLVDTGLRDPLPPDERLVDARIAAGTRDYGQGPAMDRTQCERALANGEAIVERLHEDGCNVIGLGHMGVGYSASAALLMSVFCNLALERCVGPEPGQDEFGVYHKLKLLQQVRERVNSSQAWRDPIAALSEFGGFELVTLCGLLLRAAERGMIVLIDGFATTAALLAARAFDRRVVDYCIASHRSEELGHGLMLQQLHARPLLDLRLRLGEGAGAALAYPLLAAAVSLLRPPASEAHA